MLSMCSKDANFTNGILCTTHKSDTLMMQLNDAEHGYMLFCFWPSCDDEQSLSVRYLLSG